MGVKCLDWYVKRGSMELFMIKTGFYTKDWENVVCFPCLHNYLYSHKHLRDEDYQMIKLTVVESEKRTWENSPEAQALREAHNPWRNHDTEAKKNL